MIVASRVVVVVSRDMAATVFTILVLMLVHWLMTGINPDFGLGFLAGMIFMLIMWGL